MVFFVDDVSVSKGMIKYVCGLTKESVVDIEGTVVVPQSAITGASVCVELAGCVIRCVSRAAPSLPFELEDASRPDAEADAADSPFPRVLPDTRLDNRVLDLRTPANHAIFRLQAAVGRLFREALEERGFIEIHTPKLIAGASEGGASVFKLNYMGTPACLAQSPQLYKQARARVACCVRRARSALCRLSALSARLRVRAVRERGGGEDESDIKVIRTLGLETHESRNIHSVAFLLSPPPRVWHARTLLWLRSGCAALLLRTRMILNQK